MKREFLQNLQAEGMALSKEVIDAIMAENGRDIQKAKAGFADYEQMKEQLNLAQEEIRRLQSLDFEGVRQAAQGWEEKYNQAVAAHQQELVDVKFAHLLQMEIAGAKGRSEKAITALLDVDALKKSEDPKQAISDAVTQLKKESAYLFEMEQKPPLYARGTGSQMGTEETAPTTLAGALKEKFERK